MNWQPIETAPKDGTDLIVAHISGGAVLVVCSAWYEDASSIEERRHCGDEDATDEEIGWWTYYNCVSQGKVVTQPTHWLCETPPP